MFCFAIFNRLLGCISFVKSVANRLKRKIFLNFCQRNFIVTNLILLLSMLISRNNRSILESNSEKNFFKVLPEKKPTTLLFQFFESKFVSIISIMKNHPMKNHYLNKIESLPLAMLPNKFFWPNGFSEDLLRIIWKIDRLLWLHPTPGINLNKLDSSLKDVSTEVTDFLAKWFIRSFKKIFSHILQWKMSTYHCILT